MTSSGMGDHRPQQAPAMAPIIMETVQNLGDRGVQYSSVVMFDEGTPLRELLAYCDKNLCDLRLSKIRVEPAR